MCLLTRVFDVSDNFLFLMYVMFAKHPVGCICVMCLITLYLSPPSLLQLHHALRLDGLFRHKQGLVNSGDDGEDDDGDIYIL